MFLFWEDRYFAFHGCSLNGGAPTQLVDVYDSNLPIAEVSCCSLDASTCTRKRHEDSQCFTGDNDAVKVSWIEAKSMCETQGMRLCNSQEEINKCCSSGCGYDNQLVWSGARIKPSKYFWYPREGERFTSCHLWSNETRFSIWRGDHIRISRKERWVFKTHGTLGRLL